MSSISIFTAQDIFDWIKEKEKLSKAFEELKASFSKLIDLIMMGEYKDGDGIKKFRDVFDDRARPYFFKLMNEILSGCLSIGEEAITWTETKIQPKIEGLKEEMLEGEKNPLESIWQKIKETVSNLIGLKEEYKKEVELETNNLMRQYKSALDWIIMQGEPRRERELLDFQIKATETLPKLIERTHRFIIEQQHRINSILPSVVK